MDISIEIGQMLARMNEKGYLPECCLPISKSTPVKGCKAITVQYAVVSSEIEELLNGFLSANLAGIHECRFTEVISVVHECGKLFHAASSSYNLYDNVYYPWVFVEAACM